MRGARVCPFHQIREVFEWGCHYFLPVEWDLFPIPHQLDALGGLQIQIHFGGVLESDVLVLGAHMHQMACHQDPFLCGCEHGWDLDLW